MIVNRYNILGGNIVDNFSWFEIIVRYVCNLSKKSNYFWILLSIEILWFLWKRRNENVFQGKGRVLIECNLRITMLRIIE